MILGVTGSFGTGKTTVAKLFKKYGFEVINSDELYHGIYKKNKFLRNKLLKEFGTLRRNKIRKIAFSDSDKLKKLNEITHPVIIKDIKKRVSAIIKKANDKKNDVKIVLDAPLLIEAKMQHIANKIIVVKCNEKEQIKRLLKKKKYSKKEISQIIKSQMPLKEKIKYADFVVDNSKTIKKSERQVDRIMNEICNC
ncbi:dephospho-CoA kinase [Candidatus Woesearchaeota archaeon]|nr:dephospho-CoA kinase [Candidatus Woesearchaeota archaeon]